MLSEIRIYGACAAERREPCQAGNRAALSGCLCVPQQTLYILMSDRTPRRRGHAPEISENSRIGQRPGREAWALFLNADILREHRKIFRGIQKKGGTGMYLALYRKYRPKTFEDVISQPHITTTLKNEVATGKTAHAYLFTGPRGTGKTTCSKILAMAVNCEHPVDGNPCLECDSCRGIEQGSVLDVVEIDAASNNGVDNIRQLRDEASYTPSQCRYRVYIIDETHMLSTGAFNALLKIMEEPPEHVKFILATTEAHKVPATILSRCQRFDFRRIRPEDIKSRLLSIAGQEKLSLSRDGAELIARLADGGMRDALSLLDQCAAFSDEITLDTVVQAAGVVGRDYLYELTDCIIEKDAGKAVSVIDRLYSMSKDMQGLLEEMINHFRNMMLMLTLKKPESLISVLPDEMNRLKEYTQAFPLPAILAGISEMQECLDKMSRSFDKRLTLELCFVKLCTPAMNQSADGIAARLERLENAFRSGAVSAPAASPTVREKAPAVPPKAEPSRAAGISPEPEQPASPPAEPTGESNEEESAGLPEAMMAWADILAELSQTDAPLFGVLRGSRAFTKDGVLYIDSPLSITSLMMRQEGNAAKLMAAVEKQTGNRYRIRVKSAPPKAPEADKLSDLLTRAKASGIEIREE